MPKSVKVGGYVDQQLFLVEKADMLVTKTGKPYASVVLRDHDESLEAKVWDCTPAIEAILTSGTIVEVTGKLQEYNGKRQINVEVIAKASPKDARPEDYYKKSKFDVEMMWAEVASIAESFKEPMTKYVAEKILLQHTQVIEAVKLAPAGRSMHNNWFGGLIEHIWSLCRIAEPTIAHYKRSYAPWLSADKVFFGLILHDVGKVIEYDYKNPAYAHSAIGILTNHLVLGPAWVHQQCCKFAEEGKLEEHGMSEEDFRMERAHLTHLLAAHHGILEWGSPVKPATLEAILVHQFDMIDSKFMHAWDIIEQGPEKNPQISKYSRFEQTSYIIPKEKTF